MDGGYPEAERLYVVLDNVNTRTLAALYRSLALDLEAGVPLYVQACQLAEQGGDEVFFSILRHQCLCHHLPDRCVGK